MVCKAYCGVGRVESMEEHVGRALSALRYFLARRYHEMVARRLGLDVGVVARAMELMVVFHDYGKGVEELQERCSFGGHEYISSYILYNVLSSIGVREEKLLAGAVGAVLLHHHTMKNRVGALERLGGRVVVAEECFSFFRGYLSGRGLGVRLDRELDVGRVRRFVLGDVARLVGGRFKIVGYFLYPLMFVDNVAAASRGGGSTMLGEEALRVFREWRRTAGDGR